ncbi:MAG TPA: hypothetical protein VGO21_02535, partial [Candidatus Paceibacterota bacterium]|nr:hypothetical protein [Candidatus Paceibacterota bacterium]
MIEGFKDKCQICGKIGHKTKNCPELKEIAKNESPYFGPEKEPTTITPEFLRTVFSSSEFENRLKLSAKRTTNETGEESGFIILKDIYSDRIFYGKVVSGTEGSSIGLADSKKTRGGQSFADRLERDFSFSSLHFHPNNKNEENMILAPSVDDLIMTNSNRGAMEVACG